MGLWYARDNSNVNGSRLQLTKCSFKAVISLECGDLSPLCLRNHGEKPWILATKANSEAKLRQVEAFQNRNSRLSKSLPQQTRNSIFAYICSSIA